MENTITENQYLKMKERYNYLFYHRTNDLQTMEMQMLGDMIFKYEKEKAKNFNPPAELKQAHVNGSAEICPECGYTIPEHKHGCKEYYNGR